MTLRGEAAGRAAVLGGGLAALVFTVSALLLVYEGSIWHPHGGPPQPNPAYAVAQSRAERGRPMPRSAPERIVIDAIGVDAEIAPTGVEDDGALEEPSLDEPMRAAWYRGGPSPGERGAAVILGHVSAPEPAVFYRLGALRPDDEIEIFRADGTTAVFEVDSLRSVPKGRFPTADVYGPIRHAGLRLVTCGGSFDANSGHYRNNVIVYASLVPRASA